MKGEKYLFVVKINELIFLSLYDYTKFNLCVKSTEVYNFCMF